MSYGIHSLLSLVSSLGIPLTLGIASLISVALIVVYDIWKINKGNLNSITKSPNKYVSNLGYLEEFLSSKEKEVTKEQHYSIPRKLIPPREYTAHHMLEQLACTLSYENPLKGQLRDYLSKLECGHSTTVTIPTNYYVKKVPVSKNKVHESEKIRRELFEKIHKGLSVYKD